MSPGALEWCGTAAARIPAGLAAVAGLALLVYVGLWSCAHARGRRWSSARAAAFGGGVGLVVLAATGAVGAAAGELPRHAYQHVLSGMLAPVLFVLAAPLLLLLRALPPRLGRTAMGLLRRRPVCWVVHPLGALVLSVGTLPLLFLTPLYALAMDHPAGAALVHVHLVLAGVLYTWVIIGGEPAPHRASLRSRLLLLIAGAGLHAWLAKLMYAHAFPRGTGAPLAEVRAAARIMYYGGDVAELMLAGLLFLGWYAERARRGAASVPGGGRPGTSHGEASGSAPHGCAVAGAARWHWFPS